STYFALSSVGAILSASNNLSRFCRGSPCCGGLGRFSGAGGSIGLGGSPVGGSSGAICAATGATASPPTANRVHRRRTLDRLLMRRSLRRQHGCASALF